MAVLYTRVVATDDRLKMGSDVLCLDEAFGVLEEADKRVVLQEQQAGPSKLLAAKEFREEFKSKAQVVRTTIAKAKPRCKKNVSGGRQAGRAAWCQHLEGSDRPSRLARALTSELPHQRSFW